MTGEKPMSDFNRKDYLEHRKNREIDDLYFQEDTQHEQEFFSVNDRLFIWDKPKNEAKAVIGEVEGILFVVFVQRSGELGRETRIVSARAANKKEAVAYLRTRYADYLE